MGLGLTREKVGDILVSPHWADVLVGSSVADFLLREWKQAGRVPLRVAEIGLEEIAVPEQPVKLIRDTVAPCGWTAWRRWLFHQPQRSGGADPQR